MMTSQKLEYAKAPVGRRPIWAGVLARLGPVLGLVLVFGLFAILRPRTFLPWNNVKLMLLQTAVVGTAALGMTLIIISGGIDLSMGSNIALTTVAIALALTHGASPALAAMVGVGVAGLGGLLIGLLITQLRLMPFIVTLGMYVALRGTAQQLAGGTRVNPPNATWLDALLRTPRDGLSWMVLPPGVWLMIGLALVVSGIVRYTRFGRHVFAVGSNEQTARLCGVRVKTTKVLIYLTGAMLAGVAAVLQFSYLTVGDPTTANGMELSIIAAVVIGGASLNGGEGSVFGSVIGAMVMTVISNGCTKIGLSNAVQMIVTGAIIITAVALDQLRQKRGQ